VVVAVGAGVEVLPLGVDVVVAVAVMALGIVVGVEVVLPRREVVVGGLCFFQVWARESRAAL
jgi:hypothetical protein